MAGQDPLYSYYSTGRGDAAATPIPVYRGAGVVSSLLAQRLAMPVLKGAARDLLTRGLAELEGAGTTISRSRRGRRGAQNSVGRRVRRQGGPGRKSGLRGRVARRQQPTRGRTKKKKKGGTARTRVTKKKKKKKKGGRGSSSRKRKASGGGGSGGKLFRLFS